MRRLNLIALLALALTAASAATAVAGPIDDYRRTGSIDPCKYTDGQLKNGLNNLSPDVQQYAPGLADQLSAGREGCGGSSPGTGNDTRNLQAVPGPGSPGSGGTAASGTAGDTRRARVPAPPVPKAGARTRLADIATPALSARASGSDAPGWLAPLLIVLALIAAAIAAMRALGLSAERFTRPLAASFEDAAGRTADAASQAWDRVRPSR
jgi:hypothetical protein